jgi:hypothetical protein
MEAFDYAMGLVSIVVGIAMSDLAVSFHKLFRHRRTISWDARTLLAAALTFVVLFSMWFDIWAVHGRPEILNYPFLLSIIVELVLLFLMATAVLPDEPPPNEDLAIFYDENARSIWTFFLLFQISYVGHWFYFKLTSPSYDLHHMLARLPAVLMVPVVAAVLVLVPRQRRLHLILITSLLLYWLVTSIRAFASAAEDCRSQCPQWVEGCHGNFGWKADTPGTLRVVAPQPVGAA